MGLILPGAVGIAPGLLPLAAIGLALTMVGAVATHARYGESARVVVPIIVLGLLLFVAIARLSAHSL
jgi:DoxX-like family